MSVLPPAETSQSTCGVPGLVFSHAIDAGTSQTPAACAGAAGMLSLSTAKSGALIGVLISVTTIPAAANIGIAAALGDWDTSLGSAAQLAVNLLAILLAGTLTLWIQRLLYHRRKRQHLAETQTESD